MMQISRNPSPSRSRRAEPSGDAVCPNRRFTKSTARFACRGFAVRRLPLVARGLLLALFYCAASGNPTAAEQWLREEILTYAGGKPERIVLPNNQKAGEFFNAPAGFDTISFQALGAKAINVAPLFDLHFALYGPFDGDELPRDYAKKKRAETTLTHLTDELWLQHTFPPQPAGRYYWELTNQKSNTQAGLYGRRGGTDPTGYAVINGQPAYWIDLKSAISYRGPDAPLELPEADSAAPPAPPPAGRLGARFPLGNLPLAQWLGEAALLRQLGAGSVLVSHSRNADFWQRLEKLQAAGYRAAVGFTFLDEASLAGLGGQNGARVGVSYSGEARVGDLWDPAFRQHMQEALQALKKTAAERQFTGGFQLLGPLDFNYALSAHGKKAWRKFVAEIYADNSPGADTNGDGATFNGVCGRKDAAWSACAPFTKSAAQQSPAAALLSELFFDRGLADWSAEAVAAAQPHPVSVAAGGLNRLGRLPLDAGLSLAKPTPHQLDVLARLHGPERPGAAVYDLFPGERSPDRPEKLFWLICRNLDQPLGYSLGDFGAYRPFRPSSQRQPAGGLVEARVMPDGRNLNSPQGQLARLNREAAVIRALSPFTGAAAPQPAEILVITADLDRAPFIARATYLAEAQFRRMPDFKLKPFAAIVISAAGPAALGGDLLQRLEPYVKKGGKVLVAPAQFKDAQTVLPLALPPGHASHFAWEPELPAPELRTVYHNSFDNIDKIMNDPANRHFTAPKDNLTYKESFKKHLAVKDSKLTLVTNGIQPEFLYEIRLPPGTRHALLEIRYETWHSGDFAYIWWTPAGLSQAANKFSLNLPQTHNQTNEFTRLFDVKRDFPHELLYLHGKLISGQAKRNPNDFHSAALDDIKVSITDDPLSYARQATLGEISVKYDDLSHFYDFNGGGFKELGEVQTRGKRSFPLAFSKRQGFGGGRWIYVNLPELLADSGAESAQLLDELMKQVLKRYEPPSRQYRQINGPNFLAVTKSDHQANLPDIDLQFPVEGKGPHVVFDYASRKIVPHTAVKNAVRFKTSLAGPDAARIFIIKPSGAPILLAADGAQLHAAMIDDGEYTLDALTFRFAEAAYIYSERAPKKVLAGERKLAHTYDPETKLIKVVGFGQAIEAQMQF